LLTDALIQFGLVSKDDQSPNQVGKFLTVAAGNRTLARVLPLRFQMIYMLQEFGAEQVVKDLVVHLAVRREIAVPGKSVPAMAFSVVEEHQQH